MKIKYLVQIKSKSAQNHDFLVDILGGWKTTRIWPFSTFPRIRFGRYKDKFLKSKGMNTVSKKIFQQK